MSKKPTHRLRVINRGTKKSGTIGAAWANNDGHFTINLNTGVVLSWDDDVTITLWPVTDDDVMDVIRGSDEKGRLQ